MKIFSYFSSFVKLEIKFDMNDNNHSYHPFSQLIN